MLYFYGALLVIAFGIGLIIVFIAYIFQIIAFFSIQETQPMAQAQPAAAPAAQAGMKFCPSCGTQMASSAEFCPKCGAKQSA